MSRNSNPCSNSKHGSGKSAPLSHKKNRRQRQIKDKLDRDRQDTKIQDFMRDSGPLKRERNLWVTPVGIYYDSHPPIRVSLKPKNVKASPGKDGTSSSEYSQTGGSDPNQKYGNRGYITHRPSYSNGMDNLSQSRPVQNHQHFQRKKSDNFQNYLSRRPYYQNRQTNDNYNAPRRYWDRQQNYYPQNRRFYPPETRRQDPLSGRNKMSQRYNNRSQPPRPQNRQIYKNYYPPRRDWGRQENSYPQNTRFHSQGERPSGPLPQGNQR